jgi:hypothetical protein
MAATIKTPAASQARQTIKRSLPLLGSATLLAWVLSRVSLPDLISAFGQFNWPLLIPLTLALVVFTFLWDSLCLKRLFSTGAEPIEYRLVAHARGLSYLFAIVNFSFGQGLLAFILSRARQITFAASAGRCVVMAYVDVLTLLSVGLIGASFSSDPRIRHVPLIAGTALAGLLSLVAVLKIFPTRTITRWRKTPLGDTAYLLDWSWRQLLQLSGMRLIYFSGSIIYLWTALGIAGFAIGPLVAISVLPIIAMLEGLPLSVGGLGTRETALVLLLDPPRPELLVAFCLVWSGSFISGRMLIGLISLWHPRSRQWLTLRRVTATATPATGPL